MNNPRYFPDYLKHLIYNGVILLILIILVIKTSIINKLSLKKV